MVGEFDLKIRRANVGGQGRGRLSVWGTTHMPNIQCLTCCQVSIANEIITCPSFIIFLPHLQRILGILPSREDVFNLLVRGEEGRGRSGGSGGRGTANQYCSNKVLATLGVTTPAMNSTFRRVWSHGCLSLVRVGSTGYDLSRLGSDSQVQEVE